MLIFHLNSKQRRSLWCQMKKKKQHLSACCWTALQGSSGDSKALDPWWRKGHSAAPSREEAGLLLSSAHCSVLKDKTRWARRIKKMHSGAQRYGYKEGIKRYPFVFGSGRSLASESRLQLPPWWHRRPNWRGSATRPPEDQSSGNHHCLLKQKQEQERLGRAQWELTGFPSR